MGSLSGGSLSRGVSVQGVPVQKGVQGSLCPGGLCQGDLPVRFPNDHSTFKTLFNSFNSLKKNPRNIPSEHTVEHCFISRIKRRSDSNQGSDYIAIFSFFKFLFLKSTFEDLNCAFGEELFFPFKSIFVY